MTPVEMPPAVRVACLADLSVDPGGLTYRKGGGGPDRAGERRSLAPADATACSFALTVKKRWPDTYLEILALGPLSAIPALEDLLRLGADRATLLSDPAWAGSDALVRSRILARYLRGVPFDCILAGTHTADGAGAEVPPQVAGLLGLPQLSDVGRIDAASLMEGIPLVDVHHGRAQSTYRVRLPAVLSVRHRHDQGLPHLSLRDARADVGDRLQVIDNVQLGFGVLEVGTRGSLTRVAEVVGGPARERDQLVLRCDAEGIEQVYAFLNSRGLI